MALLGSFCLLVALALTAYGAFACVVGSRRANAILLESGRATAYSLLAVVAAANLVLLLALLRDDFSVRYVAENSSRATPLFFKVLSLWSAHEGSLLLWNLVLAGYIGAVALRFRRVAPETLPWALAVLYAVSAFYLFLVVVPTPAFVQLASPPPDGRGAMPLLQDNVLMAVHPPFLYLGYIGFSVPFAFALGSLVSGRVSDAWIRITRRWTIAAWSFLTVGLTLGALWSYEVLGWGGYWAWDPVENVALMPWLTATAFLHTSLIQERRRMLPAFNLGLVITTFSLTIMGTFLTRAGIVASVHAFSRSLAGPMYLGFLILTLAAGFGLLALRGWRLRTDNRFDSILARESALLANGWVMLVLAGTVLLGTAFPIAVEVVSGRQVTVGAAYFDQTAALPFLAMLILVGVGPLLAWKRTPLNALLRRLTVPVLTAAAVLAVLAAAGLRSPLSAAVFALCALVLVANAGELGRVVSSYARSSRRPTLAAIPAALSRNRRLAGALLVHAGVAVGAAAIAASAFASQAELTLGTGAQAAAAGYVLRYDGLAPRPQSNRMVLQAPVTVLKDGRVVARLRPALDLYPSSADPITSPDIVHGPLTDMYVSVLALDDQGRTATFRFRINPGVSWLWLAGAVVALGGVIVALPPRRRRPVEVAVPRAAGLPVEARV